MRPVTSYVTRNHALSNALMLLRLLALASFVALFAPARALACECTTLSPADARRGAVAVFEGRVVSVSPVVVEEGTSTLSVEFSVARAWKGVEHERVTVHTLVDAAACGFTFSPDESYLVYATAHADGLLVDRCGRTRLAAEAEGDLRVLGMGVTPVEPKNADDDERAEPPARGGCAGCVIGDAHSHAGRGTWVLAALAGLVVSRLRRRARHDRAR